MRARRTRGRIAAVLKDRADRTKSPTVKRNLYWWLDRVQPRLYPLERILPPGHVFIPSKQLDGEAQDAMARARRHYRASQLYGAAAVSWPVALLPISRALDMSPTYTYLASTYPKLTAAAFLLTAAPVPFFAVQAARRYGRFRDNIDFATGYLQKTSNRRVTGLRSRGYRYFNAPFDYGLKKEGVVLTREPGDWYRGKLDSGHLAVVEKKTGKVLYSGPERRNYTEKPLKEMRKRTSKDVDITRW
ncbi:MAG: hypothetical protein JXB14_02455 [Candidatus Altiarchaeota archaeon]|nr:hypothetical protein [Candidatus Altiarchaeota archaeon]